MTFPAPLFAPGVVVLAVAALLARGRVGARALGTAFAVLALALGTLVLCERTAVAAPAVSAAAVLLRTLAMLAAWATWGALCVLSFHGTRRRDLIVIGVAGLLIVVTLGDRTPSSGAALLPALLLLARWRWMDGIGRRGRALALVAAAALPVLAFWPVPGDRAAATAPGFVLVRYAAWARELAGLYLLLALPGLLNRWSVGVRRVSRRLALLLLFSGVVPALLVTVMWGFSTQLGVRAERGLFASRMVEQEAAALRAELVVAGAASRSGPEPLLALRTAHPGRAGLRLWRGGRRVHGAPVTDEAALRQWPDSLHQACMVLLGREAWLAARMGTRGDTILALVPLQEVLDADVRNAAGGRLSLLAQFEADSLVPARSDRARRAPAGSAAGAGPSADTSGVRFRIGGQRVFTGRELNLTAGHGLLNGIGWTGTRWEERQGLLSVDLRWRDVALGLFQGARDNPMNYVSLALLGLLSFLVVMLAGADFGMVRSLGRSITAAVAALRQGAGRLEAGDLAHRIPVEGDDDLWEVAGAFNRMAAGLERAREREIERQRIEDELALARRIQARLLPTGPPQVPGLELAGASEPAREVGGDYFDYLPLEGGRVALVIADVSGKGVGAALLMSGFRASLLSQDLARDDAAVVLARLNQFLHRSVEPGRFVTAFLGVLDGATGRLVYCNAGHNAPMIVPVAAGAVRRLEAGGLILGIQEHSGYETGEERLAPGERLVLFTDGVTEAADARDEQWGEERLVALLREAADQTCAAVVDRIIEAVRGFEGARGASDDVTLIVARRSAGAAGPA